MNFMEMLVFWNELISDPRNAEKQKEDFDSVLIPVLVSGSIAGFFFGMGYGFFYLDIANTLMFSLLGLFFGPFAILVSLVFVNSLYFLTSAVFGARKTTIKRFFGPQSAVHSLFSIIFGAIFAISGLLSLLNPAASRIFFSAGLIPFALYYVYVMSYLIHFQTGFSGRKSLSLSLVIPLTTLSLYLLIRALLFLTPVD